MCGLCGFGLADAELVLGRGALTDQVTGQSTTDSGQDAADPVTQSPTCDGIAADTIQPTAGSVPQPTDGIVATLWARLRQALAGQPSPSHGL